jgi:molecular chaperone GrpE
MSKASKEPKPPPPAPGAPAATPEAAADAPPLSPQELEVLKAAAAKAAEHWDRLLRTSADFDNFRKRAAREKQDAIKFANETLLARLLPVLDSFDAALAAANGAPDHAAESLRAGLNLVQQQFKAALTEAGVEEVNATGQPFDPNFHEAVAQQQCAETPEGQVLQQLRKGYKLRDRLLRPATVIVAKKPTPQPEAQPDAVAS